MQFQCNCPCSTSFGALLPLYYQTANLRANKTFHSFTFTQNLIADQENLVEEGANQLVDNLLEGMNAIVAILQDRDSLKEIAANQ